MFLGRSIFICAAFLIATVGSRYVFWYPRNDLELDTRQEIKEKLSKLNQQKDEIQHTLNDDLVPVQDNLESQLQIFSQIIECKKALSLYAEMDSTYDEDFVEYDKVDAEIDYKPKTLFEADFADKIASYFKTLLAATYFKPIDIVVFDMTLFDVIVNDNPKPNRSKGYAAYLNSLLVLSLRSLELIYKGSSNQRIIDVQKSLQYHCLYEQKVNEYGEFVD